MRILLIDDHALFRQGLMMLLSGLDAAAEFIEADGVEQALKVQDIQLILLDLHLDGTRGLDALEAVRTAFNLTPIVVVSGDDRPSLIRQTIEQGALGFIPKSSDGKVLLPALQLILAGGTYLPPQALNLEDRADGGDSSAVARLTRRQQEILQLALNGAPNKAIAKKVDLTESTVKAHLSAAFRCLGVKNRTEAVYVAAQLGLNFGGESTGR